MIEMVGPVLTRALRPFPVPVRTLDAIHLSALEFVREQKQSVQLASYDGRLAAPRGFSESGARASEWCRRPSRMGLFVTGKRQGGVA